MSDNKENVPLDQMMRKLKKSPAQNQQSIIEGGERVVRADGSQAIKVRTNKRRSIQPQKVKEQKSNKRKFFLFIAGLVLLLLTVIAYYILLGYFNGNRFKSKLAETVVNVSGAEIELGALNVSAASAKLSNIDLKWSGDDTLLKTLKVKGIHADYGMLALIGSGWGGSAVGIEKAELGLEMGVNPPRLTTSLERPVNFKLGLYQCSEFSIDFGSDSLWSFENGSVAYRARNNGDSNFSIDSGNLKVPKFGEFKVRSGNVGLSSNSAEVFLDLKPAVGGSSSLSVDGSVGYNEGSLVDLKIELKDYPLKNILDPRAKRFFNGKIQSGKGTLKMNLGDIDSFDIKTSITSDLINVNDFEFFKTISDLLTDEYYLRPVFTDASEMTISWTKRRIEFTDIDLHKEGQMRIKGNLSIDENDQLSGLLKIGLPTVAIYSKKQKGLKHVFREDDGEYIWADVNISGKAISPIDNLDERLLEASAKVSTDTGEEGIKPHEDNSEN